MTILVADDEINILNLYRIRLEKRGYDVITAVDGQDALDKFYSNSSIINLIILDVMMPKLSGIEVIKEIRDNKYLTPAIIVSAKGEINYKIDGFNNGVDDYMTKPFEFDELFLRIQALLRRNKIAFEQQIVINDTILDYNSLTIKDNDKSLKLAKKDFQILFKLLSYPERVFTKDELFDEFWSYESESTIDTVKVHISTIRNQISDFPSIGIETIRGIGYKGIRNEK